MCPSLVLVLLMMSSLRTFFVASAQDISLGVGNRSEELLDLRKTSGDSLEQAKRLSREYAIFREREKKRQKKERDRSKYEKCRVQMIQHQLKYNQSHQDEHNQRQANYNEAHRSEVRQRQSNYNEAHRSEVRQRQSNYNEAHRSEVRQRQSNYNEAHRSEVRQRQSKYNEKRTRLSSTSTTNNDRSTDDLESFLRFLDADRQEKVKEKLLERITRQLETTCVGGDPSKQQARVCVICDQIIFEMEPMKHVTKTCLLENDTRLCVSQYEQHFGIQLHPELVRQYQVSMSLLIFTNLYNKFSDSCICLFSG
jgi:hypothetical protein